MRPSRFTSFCAVPAVKMPARAERAAGPLPAAHGEDDRPRLHGNDPLRAAYVNRPALRGEGDDHRPARIGDVKLPHAGNIARRVFGASQLLLKRMQAEAVVDALAEDAAERVLPLKDQEVFHARLARGTGRGKPRQPAIKYTETLHRFHILSDRVKL